MRIVFVLFAIVTVGMWSLVDAQQTAPTSLTVKDLREQGWEVKDMSSRNETRPGLPPYENLPRVVSITTYVLIRGDETITCDITYDSQRDNLQENCVHNGS